MDGRTDRRMDVQIPPVFYRTSSPPVPSGAAAQKEGVEREREGVEREQEEGEKEGGWRDKERHLGKTEPKEAERKNG